jgi:argininosuccinate lyase
MNFYDSVVNLMESNRIINEQEMHDNDVACEATNIAKSDFHKQIQEIQKSTGDIIGNVYPLLDILRLALEKSQIKKEDKEILYDKIYNIRQDIRKYINKNCFFQTAHEQDIESLIDKGNEEYSQILKKYIS